MVSPKVTHGGFLVPNAVGLTHPRMAEPDQIDFATVANARWGVVEGCAVTVSTSTVMVAAGVAIVNGRMVNVTSGSVTLGQSGTQDRFDSVVVDDGGKVKVLPGAYAVDPVFVDVPLDNTLLAVVFCPTGADTYDGNVIDKRKFVPKSLLTRVLPTEYLVYNMNGLSGGSGGYGFFAGGSPTFDEFTGTYDGAAPCHFSILGDGYMEWEGDTCLYRSDVKTLRVKDHLQVAGMLGVTGEVYAAKLRATQEVTGSNLLHQPVPPAAGTVPLGALHQNPVNGDLSVNTPTGWKALAVADGIVPVGTLIQSMEVPSVMIPKGWVPFDGTPVDEATYPRLFTLSALAGLHFGSAPNRSMTLPDASNRVLVGSKSSAGNRGGSNSINLTLAQMPRHKHNTRTNAAGGMSPSGSVGRVGGHSHPMQISGAHAHNVIDNGHAHNGGSWPHGAYVCLTWGGQNKIDALFNDRNHTYSVEAADWSREARTGIQVGGEGSQHVHAIDSAGDHDHPLYMNALPEHNHTVSEDEQGLGAAIDITPAYMTVFTYIRS